MNTNTKGGHGESRFIHEFTKLGWKVSLPLGHDAAYDMIVDNAGVLSRVQIKSCTSTEDVMQLRLDRTYTSGKRIVTKLYSLDDFDLLGVYDLRTEECYLLPITDVADRAGISLRFVPTRNGQKKNVLMAVDFLVSKHI